MKLHSEAIKNDMNISETSFCSRFYRLLLSTFLDYTFWIYALHSPEWYSPKAILNDISSSCGENGLPLIDLNKWWMEWVEHQNYDENKKRECIDNITYYGTIFDEPITLEGQGKPNPILLKRMFFEMGLLV